MRFSLAALWSTESAAFSFFLLVVPVLMRQQGFDLATIGLIYTMVLPQMFSWLFGILFDRYNLFGMREKSWLVLLLTINAALLATMAFLELKTDFTLLFVLMMASSLVSRLIGLLCSSIVKKAWGEDGQNWMNGIMVSSMAIGMVAGGGVMLYIIESFSWTGCLLVLSAAHLSCLPLLLSLTYPDKKITDKVSAKRLITLFKTPGLKRWALIMMLFYGANQGVYAMLKPFLVDLGLPNEEIALLTGLFTAAIGIIAGVTGSYMVHRFGARHSLNTLAGLMLSAILMLMQVKDSTNHYLWLYPASTLLIFSSFTSYTVLCVVSMSYCRQESSATDFSILTVLPYLGAMPFASLSGVITEALGYQGFFICAALLSVACILVIYLMYRKQTEIRYQSDQNKAIA